MPSRATTKSLVAAMVLVALAPGAAQAVKIEISPESYLEVDGFVQTWLRVDDASQPDAPEWNGDFYLRRWRVFFKGQVSESFRFLVGTLDLDLGKRGDYQSRMRLGDAWMEWSPAKAFKVDVGLLKLPFSRHGQQGGGKLHGLDFHGAFLKRRMDAPPHRDVGVMFRGLLLDEWLDARLALVDGQEASGEHDLPRVVGRLGINLFDAEPTFFWAGTYLGKKKILSVGFSFDVQPGVMVGESEALAYALAVDLLADIPFEDDGFVFTLNAYLNGPGMGLPEGSGLWFDLGYRFGSIEPLVAAEWYEPKEGDKGKRLVFMGGLNWWIQDHRANLKLQMGTAQLNNSDDWSLEAIVQAHLFF